jgi:hypothetical protein
MKGAGVMVSGWLRMPGRLMTQSLLTEALNDAGGGMPPTANGCGVRKSEVRSAAV